MYLELERGVQGRVAMAMHPADTRLDCGKQEPKGVHGKPRQRLAEFSDIEEEVSLAPPEDHETEQSQADADEDDASYDEDEEDNDTEEDDDTDDDGEGEKAEEETPPTARRANTRRATKKPRTAAQPAVTVTKKRSSLRASEPPPAALSTAVCELMHHSKAVSCSQSACSRAKCHPGLGISCLGISIRPS